MINLMQIKMIQHLVPVVHFKLTFVFLLLFFLQTVIVLFMLTVPNISDKCMFFLDYCHMRVQS